MSNIVGFTPKTGLDASNQLASFIEWAKATLPKGIPNRVHAGIRWDNNSWHAGGVTGVTFRVLGAPKKNTVANSQYMSAPFLDFVKAYIVYRKVFLGNKSVVENLPALRALEVALIQLTGSRDVTQISAEICNRACELLKIHLPNGNNAYMKSHCLKQVIKFMNEKGMVAQPFRWSSPLKLLKSGSLKQQKKNRLQKLPSRESIQALGEMFNNNLSEPLDIVVTSACALLMSNPARIGELADVEYDPIVFKEAQGGGKRMFLKWFAEKGFGAKPVPVITGMESVVERLIEKMRTITDEARSYAAWLEEHPNEFPPHETLPNKGLDDALTYAEVCETLKIAYSKAPRTRFRVNFVDSLLKSKVISPAAMTILNEIKAGWDKSKGKRVFYPGVPGIQGIQFDDKAVITLRKLNILMREKYLPKHFPYTTPFEEGKPRVKYRDALFTVRTGTFAEEVRGRLIDFGVEISVNPNRMSVQLGGSRKEGKIFERHGYKGVKVNTHAFRHELNTEMHRAGLSQLLIDAFSGRTSMGSVYNHETVEERTEAVAEVHPKTKQSIAANRLEKINTNSPIRLSDVIELAENSQDRVIHQTHVGICVHNFASEPCPKMGSCLRCGKLACVKGDDEKLKNIKEERDYFQKRYNDALAAESRGEFGAKAWVAKVHHDLLKCEALIKLLESPQLENGDIIWNVDDGWNLTNNAAVMAGLIDASEVIEVNEKKALSSLDELSAMMLKVELS
uniref:hypothetical protein n=1 Tax=Rheinheimera sp. TaxID=1869214 RepID=UPI0040482E31